MNWNHLTSAVSLALFLFFVLFALFLIGGFFAFRNANHRRKRYPADRRAHGGHAPLPPKGKTLLDESRAWFDSEAWETVSIRSEDNLTLRGTLLPAEGDARGVVLLFHGYHSSCRRDASVQAKALHEAGYHLLLVSQRAHGESEGHYICFGAKEKHDAALWCHLAEGRFPTLPLILMGISMGGATVLFAAEEALPDSVCAIVADCPFTSPFEIIRRTLWHKHKLPPIPLIFFMNLWSKCLAGFSYRSISVDQTLRCNKRPILLIHGTHDTYVPAAMSDRIAQSHPEHLQYLRVEGAKHCQSVYTSPELYLETLLSFLEKHAK